MAAKRIRKAKKETAKESSSANPVTSPFHEWFGYIKGNAFRYYAGLLKIALTALLATWIFALLMLGLGILLFFMAELVFGISAEGFDLEVGFGGWLLIGILVLAAFIMQRWVQKSIQLTALVFTEAEFEKGGFRIIESALRASRPVLRFVLLDFGLTLLLALPALALVSYGFYNPGMEVLALSAAIGYALFAVIAYFFLVQFWAYGFVLGGFGVIDSLKRSVAISVRRARHVALFDVAWLVGMLFFAMPFLVFALFSEVIVADMQPAAGAGVGAWATYLLVAGIVGIVGAVLASIMESFSTPTHYLFWKGVKP